MPVVHFLGAGRLRHRLAFGYDGYEGSVDYDAIKLRKRRQRESLEIAKLQIGYILFDQLLGAKDMIFCVVFELENPLEESFCGMVGDAQGSPFVYDDALPVVGFLGAGRLRHLVSIVAVMENGKRVLVIRPPAQSGCESDDLSSLTLCAVFKNDADDLRNQHNCSGKLSIHVLPPISFWKVCPLLTSSGLAVSGTFSL